MKLHFSRLLVTVAVVAAVLGLPVATSAAVMYYVSLGDSLAAGVQPTGMFDQGYADQLFNTLRASIPNLKHVKLGCGGETTATMTTGGGSALTRMAPS